MRVSKGVLYMLLAAFVFSLMKVSVKYVSHIPPLEVIMFRCIISLVISVIMLKKQRVSVWGSNKRVLVLRGITGAIALSMYFYLLQKIPLAAAASMQYLSPIFAAILGVFIVKEKVRSSQYVFFGISFFGVLIIQGIDARITWSDLLIGITASFMTGLAYNFVRMLKTSEHPLVIIFYFPLVTLPVAAIASVFYWVTPIGIDWLYLVLVGVLTQIAQYYMTRAYQEDEISKVSIVNYTGILYSVVFGLLLFGETYEWLSYLGMGLVVVGVILNVVTKKP